MWTSQLSDDPKIHEVLTKTIEGEFTADGEPSAKIAVFVTLSVSPDETAFRQLVREQPGFSSAAEVIFVRPIGRLDAREAARISVKVANEIKRISAQFGRAEIHLAFHGPFTMAVLLGRHLNTLRTVVYEWDNPEATGPVYIPVLTIELGVARGPITQVHL